MISSGFQGLFPERSSVPLVFALCTMVASLGGHFSVACSVEFQRLQHESAAVVLEDFEDGLTKWAWTDTNHVVGQGGANLVEAYSVPVDNQEISQQGALFLFRKAENSWARLHMRLDGVQLQEAGCTEVSLWVRGDGGNVVFDIVLLARSVAGLERSYSKTLHINGRGWNQVNIPLAEIRDREGRVASRALDSVFALQFSKQGSWESFFFFVDQIVASRVPGDALQARPTPQQRQTPRGGVSVNVDFENVIGQTRLRVGSNIHGMKSNLLQKEEITKLISSLDLGLLRIRTSDQWLWKDDEEISFDFERLDELVGHSKSLGADPLICVSPRDRSKVDDGTFVKLVADVVGRYVLSPLAVKCFELFHRPTSFPLRIPLDEVIENHVVLKENIQLQNASSLVGGFGDSSAWQSSLQKFVRRVGALDFISFHFYGIHNASTDDDQLFDAARRGVSTDLPNQMAPLALRRLLERAGGKNTEIMITECNLNSLRGAERGDPDERVSAPMAAAWFATLFARLSRDVDHLLQSQLIGNGWGLVDNNGKIAPAYWAVWFYNNFFPKGTVVCRVSSSSDNITVLAGRTEVGGKLLLVNTTGVVLTAYVESTLREPLALVRALQISPRDTSLTLMAENPVPLKLVAAPVCPLDLPPYSITVVEFFTD